MNPGTAGSRKDAIRGLLHAQRLSEAKALARGECEATPMDPEAWQLLGTIHRSLGENAEAEHCLRQALGLRPTADTHFFLGNVLAAQNRFEEAVTSYREALALDPQNPMAHNNLGRALYRLGRHQEAAEALREALRLRPDLVEVRFNLGVLHAEQHQLEEAVASFRETLRLRPDSVEAYQSLGNALGQMGRYDEAVACYRQALRLRPDNVDVLCNLGQYLVKQDQFDEAVACFRRALARRPDHADAYVYLGNAFANQGLVEEAADAYRRALERQPSDAVRIKLATLMPVIMESTESIARWRAVAEQQLRALLAGDLVVRDPLKEVGVTNFYLAYHGLNDRELQALTARVHEKACPALIWTAPHCKKPAARRDGPLRVGLLSKHLYTHSIGRVARGLFAHLSRDRFRVYALFVPPVAEDELMRSIRESADEAHVLPPELQAARERIAALELDILFYQDIGMEPFSYFLAFSRLAPVQCVTYGHPDTTGIGNIDYWVSNDLYEPEGAEAHYSERLYLLHDLATLAYYYRPRVPEPLKDRAALGLPEDAHIYLCPQTLFKLHPDFDPILAGILGADPRARIVFRSPISQGMELVQKRLARALGADMKRILFLPYRDSFVDYFSLLAVADVVLDTPHFNGMNTSLEAFAVGAPVVTWPGAFQRGRHTYAMYRKMAIEECVARDPGEYARIAVRLGTDPAFRQATRAKILARNHVLFEDMAAIREFERFFLDAAARTAPS
ncbi:MAG: tetratricopeptide repeat protein [Gammaproteobacteria bacterium]|nr:tetratricopeptide repeat protein [Gammaproteobacteria bacterium]